MVFQRMPFRLEFQVYREVSDGVGIMSGDSQVSANWYFLLADA